MCFPGVVVVLVFALSFLFLFLRGIVGCLGSLPDWWFCGWSHGVRVGGVVSSYGDGEDVADVGVGFSVLWWSLQGVETRGGISCGFLVMVPRFFRYGFEGPCVGSSRAQ